jgi:hypothetical protein
MIQKSSFQFIPHDFDNYPIWKPIDDLEDEEQEVTPMADIESLDSTEIYFIAAQFFLADGSVYDGYLRLSWFEVKEFNLAISDSKFAFYAIGIKDPTGEYHKELAEELDKKIDDVFPIKFRTKVQFMLSGTTF